MRGGRGGRGRGAGSASQSMIRETAMDLGLNSYRLDQNEAPPLYPSLDLPPAARIMEKDVCLVSKQRELVADSVNSPYFITPKYVVRDVERYSVRFTANGNAKDKDMASVLTSSILDILPAELVDLPTGHSGGALQAGLKRNSKFDAKSLTALEDREKQSVEQGGDKDREKDGVLSDLEPDIEEEESQEEEDYLRNHYDSDVESDADDSGAVF
ncbi:unnamed protein product [Choristocarpus tenellus]